MIPQICFFNDGYTIRWTRPSGVVLMWVQDLTGRKLKDTAKVSRPVVIFADKASAMEELYNVVIPYILKEKL